MTVERCDAIVLGGGPAGLAAADRLAEGGMRVVLLEADTELGGLAKSFRQDGKWIPITYHHVMGIDTATHRFLKRFGLWESMVWKSIKVVFWFHGKAYPLVQPWHILGFATLTSSTSQYNHEGDITSENTGFYAQNGIVLEPLHIALWALPTAVAAFAIHGCRIVLFARRMRKERADA